MKNRQPKAPWSLANVETLGWVNNHIKFGIHLVLHSSFHDLLCSRGWKSLISLHKNLCEAREGERKKGKKRNSDKPTTDPWGAPSGWQMLCAWHRVESTDLQDRAVSGHVWVSDKLLSHDAALCLRTLGEVLTMERKTKRVEEDRDEGRRRRGVFGQAGERERRSNGRMGVTVTTARWRQIEGGWEVAGCCFCSLTAWQSPLDEGPAPAPSPQPSHRRRLGCNSVWQAGRARGADTDAPFFRRDAQHNASIAPASLQPRLYGRPHRRAAEMSFVVNKSIWYTADRGAGVRGDGLPGARSCSSWCFNQILWRRRKSCSD